MSSGGNEEAISLFTMQHSAGTKEDRHTKAFNNVLNMDAAGESASNANQDLLLKEKSSKDLLPTSS